MAMATAAMTLPPHSTGPTTIHNAPSCPNCGHDIPLPSTLDATQEALLAAQQHIDDLQAQVRLLNDKASAAADRWADYEDELTRLRAALAQSQQAQQQPPPQQQQQEQGRSPSPHVAVPAAKAPSSPARNSFLGSAGGRLSQLLSPRKSQPNLGSASGDSTASSPAIFSTKPASASASASALATALPTPFTPWTGGQSQPQPQPQSQSQVQSSPSAEDLMAALGREQRLRAAAEGRLHDTSREVEELSATLFEQANEMVAAERRARAALERRVETLERRDADKRRRLDRLENAIGRIERVRALLEVTPLSSPRWGPGAGFPHDDDDVGDDDGRGATGGGADGHGVETAAAGAQAQAREKDKEKGDWLAVP